MALLGPDGFDATKHEPMGDFPALPKGKYLAAVVESELKPTRKGDGEYLELRFQVLEGDYKGRLLFSRLNLRNPSPEAEKMARAELSAICRAAGVMTPEDSEELHDIPMLVAVRLKKRHDNGELGNEIRGYYPKAVGTVQAAVEAESVPWEKN